MKKLKREAFDLMLASSVLTLDQHNHNESISHLEHRLELVTLMMKDLRKAQCQNLRKSVLKAFSEELRDCRRGRNSSPITLVYHFSFTVTSIAMAIMFSRWSVYTSLINIYAFS